MAPELFSGDNANNTVDVYSFGCIILELLSNHTISFRCTFDDFIDYMNRKQGPFIPDYLPESRMNSLLF